MNFKEVFLYFDGDIRKNPLRYDDRSKTYWLRSRDILYDFPESSMRDIILVSKFSLSFSRFQPFDNYITNFEEAVHIIRRKINDPNDFATERNLYCFTNLVLCDVWLMAYLFREVMSGTDENLDKSDLVHIRKYFNSNFEYVVDSTDVTQFDRRLQNTSFMLFRVLADHFLKV